MRSVAELESHPEDFGIHTAAVVQYGELTNTSTDTLLNYLLALVAEQFDLCGAGLNRVVNEFCDGVCRIAIPVVAHCLNGKVRRYEVI